MTKPLINSMFLASISFALPNMGLAEGAIYFSLGAAETSDPLQNSDVPLSFGIMGFQQNGLILGFDFGMEGTMLDSTWGLNDPVAQGRSYNLIIGHNLNQTDRTRLDVGALIGLRETVADCPDSFLGYQCYANTAPNVDYGVNYGVVVTLSVQRALFGLRATGESVQAMIGTRF